MLLSELPQPLLLHILARLACGRDVDHASASCAALARAAATLASDVTLACKCCGSRVHGVTPWACRRSSLASALGFAAGPCLAVHAAAAAAGLAMGEEVSAAGDEELRYSLWRAGVELAKDPSRAIIRCGCLTSCIGNAGVAAAWPGRARTWQHST